VIVVDPRRIPLASKADHWMQVRPGTDDALALGMLHVIIKEYLYDKDFVRNWTTGFDKLAERVGSYSPEEVEAITWVPAETIRAAAECTLQQSRRASSGAWDRPEHEQLSDGPSCPAPVRNHRQHRCARRRCFLGAPGERRAANPQINPSITLTGKIPPEMWAKKIGAGKHRVLEHIQVQPRLFFEAVLSETPNPIKALLLMGQNTFLTHSYSTEMARLSGRSTSSSVSICS